MASGAHAAIDVSDGLACDVGHMAAASDVAIVLDEEALGADDALCSAAKALGKPALDFALYGGEDYALVMASSVAVPGFRPIGSVELVRESLREARAGNAQSTRRINHFRADSSVTGKRLEVSRS